MSFESEHADRVRDRVRTLMAGAKQAHTIEEIKARLEKLHGVRFSKNEIAIALGRLKSEFEITRTERDFPHEPKYSFRELPATQIPLFSKDHG